MKVDSKYEGLEYEWVTAVARNQSNRLLTSQQGDLPLCPALATFTNSLKFSQLKFFKFQP